MNIELKTNEMRLEKTPSRAGNLLILAVGMSLVLALGSYLAYRYRPPPPLGLEQKKSDQIILNQPGDVSAPVAPDHAVK